MRLSGSQQITAPPHAFAGAAANGRLAPESGPGRYPGMDDPVRAELRFFIVEALAEVAERDPAELAGDTRLLGEGGTIRSRELVELLLLLDERIEERFHAKFDWAADRSISPNHEPFRTVESLADFIARQIEGAA